jgi:hypothetical protein
MWREPVFAPLFFKASTNHVSPKHKHTQLRCKHNGLRRF